MCSWLQGYWQGDVKGFSVMCLNAMQKGACGVLGNTLVSACTRTVAVGLDAKFKALVVLWT